MPEQLTKHPEVTLRVLQSGGARCGEGAPQAILSTCPAERFCALPGGEICVYGLGDAARMTQLGAGDWQALAALTGALPMAAHAPPAAPWGYALMLLVGLVAGASIAGVAVRRRRARR